jgi:hypothetical protein
MYGMIHRGLRQMVIDKHGDAMWGRVAESVGVGPQNMLTGLTYDDELTMSVIAACCDDLGLELEEILEAFGEYCIGCAASGVHARSMEMAGGDPPKFIDNLDRLHKSVQSVMADPRLPEFTVVRQQPGRSEVADASDRTGLEPFVKGLLEGPIDAFGLAGDVAIDETGTAGRLFEVRSGRRRS